MKLDLNKKQYKELLLLVSLGEWVRNGVADTKGEYSEKMNELRKHLLTQAREGSWDDLIEEFEGHLLPAENINLQVEEIMEEYDEDEFWHQLMVELGQRDFFRTITNEEKAYIEKEKWLPPRINEIYKKYGDEFEDHGIERLEIVEK
jgi:hypothetical protein